MSVRGRLTILASVAILAAGCSSGAASAAPSAVASAIASASNSIASPSASASESASTSASGSASASASAAVSASPMAGGLLDKVMKAGKLVVSTDPKYPPQSVLNKDGTYSGFDIDVANEIGKRLGVKVEFVTPDWSAITAGGWGGRWDMSVGSMTITPDRKKALDFSPPYYYTPAQMAASKASGITTLDGFAGKTICSGESTTYDQWLKGTLDYGTGQPLPKPPAGIKSVTLPTDTDCADQWKAGRNDFEGWLTSKTTVDGAVKAGLPVVPVGEPVYYEPLGVAVDKSGPNDSDFIPLLSKIVEEMHADGTLTQLSQKAFGADFSKETTTP